MSFGSKLLSSTDEIDNAARRSRPFRVVVFRNSGFTAHRARDYTAKPANAFSSEYDLVVTT